MMAVDKSQRLKVFMIHSLGTMNVCNKLNDNSMIFSDVFFLLSLRLAKISRVVESTLAKIR